MKTIYRHDCLSCLFFQPNTWIDMTVFLVCLFFQPNSWIDMTVCLRCDRDKWRICRGVTPPKLIYYVVECRHYVMLLRFGYYITALYESTILKFCNSDFLLSNAIPTFHYVTRLWHCDMILRTFFFFLFKHILYCICPKSLWAQGGSRTFKVNYKSGEDSSYETFRIQYSTKKYWQENDY